MKKQYFVPSTDSMVLTALTMQATSFTGSKMIDTNTWDIVVEDPSDIG